MSQAACDYLWKSFRKRNKKYVEMYYRDHLIAATIGAFFAGVAVTLFAFRFGWLS